MIPYLATKCSSALLHSASALRGIRQIPESLSTARFLPAPAVCAMRYTMQQLPIVRPGKKCPDFPALSLSLSFSFLFFPTPSLLPPPTARYLPSATKPTELRYSSPVWTGPGGGGIGWDTIGQVWKLHSDMWEATVDRVIPYFYSTRVPPPLNKREAKKGKKGSARPDATRCHPHREHD
jgi:hypothetical protein